MTKKITIEDMRRIVILDAFDYKPFDIYSLGKLEKLQKIAQDRGGRCLSDAYINSTTPLKWQCSPLRGKH